MKNRYFTKFCGITNIEDALNAQNIGCNALGFVFVEKSKRFIDTKTCQKIINKLSPTILTVALFANNSELEIQETLNKCSIHVLQFHGNESPEFCKQWNMPYWKAIPMADDIDAIEYASKYPDAQAYLIDNYGVNQCGGSGKSFDWSDLPQGLDNKWILAGGLHCKNIVFAKQQTAIKCFDISSGIEKSPGIKCKNKMKEFITKLND
ncbi:MAG: phosphoribosylanthranilate isomerase [Alcanivoracaceae bacterium]|nr:phosphoribosylanthranilate isomerase [Alcanivoracaceae bacterium]